MASAALVTSCGALTRRVWTRTELSCTSSEERSPDTCIVHLRLSTRSDCSTRLIRTKTESFPVRLGLSRAAPTLRSQLCSDFQTFPSSTLPSHCGAECFKTLHAAAFQYVQSGPRRNPSLRRSQCQSGGSFLQAAPAVAVLVQPLQSHDK